MNIAYEVEALRKEKVNFAIQSLADVRRALILKYGNLTKAAQALGIHYNFLSNILGGRIYLVYAIQKLQQDLDLTDQQVLEFWPLLKKWPKEPRNYN
jgi:hypothetical protein